MPRRCRIFVLLTFLIASSSGTQCEEPDSRNRLPQKQHRTSNAPFLSPEKAVGEMSIPPGFDVSVFASEPTIAEPIAFCFDDQGRIWVVENFNYQTRRQHSDDPVSRIQILTDTDGDGVFDEKKTFSDSLTFSSGIAVGFGGVFVGSPPNLTFFADADGDDKPDGPPQILLDGWGINDRHETLNSFIWGPDGWLYGCHGVFTQSKVGKPGDPDERRQFIDGGIWRYHPTRHTFEVFARGLSNPWGFDFNDHGQAFATCCVIPHLFHIIQGGVYHKQSRPHVNPHIYDDIKTIRTHTHLSAHGGARVYLADEFGPKYRDRLFMCNIHEHAVLTDILTPNGSGFIGSEGDDFLPANDMAWVGFSVETGPEGGVYILDWHDTDVCGNAVNFPNSGRIYRITHEDTKPIERPDLRALSDSELTEMQWHRNDWYVRHARVLLQSRLAAGDLDTESVHRRLYEMLDTGDTSAKRLRALWGLHVTEGLDHDTRISLLDHEDHYIRAWAIQFIADASDRGAFHHHATNPWSPSPDEMHRLERLAKEDPSPVVRLYLASLIQRVAFEYRWPILRQLLSHGEDIDDHNLWRMYWYALEPMVSKHPDKALVLAADSQIPKIAEFVARRIMTGGPSVDSRIVGASQSTVDRNRLMARAAPGFTVHRVGEGGVVFHPSFRNRTAVQTHPQNREVPSHLTMKAKIPADKPTHLHLTVSHHPHGDWQLRVLADNVVIADQIVGSRTVTQEWLDLKVDLSQFAGQTIELKLENRANNWANEWAYWHQVALISE